MTPMIKIDLLTGKFSLYGKTNRAHQWKVRVSARQGNALETYDFKLSHKMPLGNCMAALADVVRSEIKELTGRAFDSVVCEVGI